MSLTKVQIDKTFRGPPIMGHGGYVAGLLAQAAAGEGALQVTLRRPAPLERELTLEVCGDGRVELRADELVVADAEPAVLSLDVPLPPTLAQARATEPKSPSFYRGHGVHGGCFGCGKRDDDGSEPPSLEVFAGPIEVEGKPLVAGGFLPGPRFADHDGMLNRHGALAALDCPGAFAFIVDGQRAGLLGRIVFEHYRRTPAQDDHIVIGWQVGTDGRKLYAGTALYDTEGRLCAAAKATWFGQKPR